jgi:hypothetical protein
MQQRTVFIDLQDQLNIFRTNICPSSGLQITACVVVSGCSARLAVRRAAAWSYVLGVKEDAWLQSGIFLPPSCRRSSVEIVGSNSAKVMVICLLLVFCVVR